MKKGKLLFSITILELSSSFVWPFSTDVNWGENLDRDKIQS